jgi:hypothetical protein
MPGVSGRVYRAELLSWLKTKRDRRQGDLDISEIFIPAQWENRREMLFAI